MKKYILLTTLAFAALLANNSVAEQSGTGHYISGQQADFSTLNPSAPGWYFVNIFLNYNDGTADASKGLPFGRLIALDVTVNMTGDIPALIYAYPWKVFGATLSSAVYIPIVSVDVKAQGTIDHNGVEHSVTQQQSVNGIGDMEWTPAALGWTNGDFHYNAMFNIWTPNGSYNQGELANLGLGYWTFEPMVAASWLSTKIGTEVTVFSALDFNTENYEANYQSGDIFHVDGTVAQHLPLFGGIAGAGATAFYLKQITGDSGSGAKLGSFEVESYGAGPTLSYVHPLGKSTLVFDATWLPQTHVERTTKGDYVWVKAAIAF